MGLFGGSTPAPGPVVPMPDPESQDAARRRAIARRRSGTGQASTVLDEQRAASDAPSTLG